MHVLTNTVCTTAWNLLPKWNSTPHHQQAKKRYKKSHSAGKYSCNLGASKKSCFNKSNCMSGRHNKMKRNFSTLRLTSVYHKARRMICKPKKMKPLPIVCWPLPTPEEPDLCNNFMSNKPEYIDWFCINFPWHCVLGHIFLDSNPLNDVDSWKEVVQPSRKPRNVGSSKSKPKKTTSKTKIN